MSARAELGDMSARTELRDMSAIPLDDIRSAQRRIRGHVVRTPLVRLNYDVPGKQIYLKLENLQPVHSFKLRGATNALRQLSSDQLARGVYSCSAGNFAQGLAYSARQLGVSCDVIMPDTAPRTKVSAVERYGGRVTQVSYDEWWAAMEEQRYPGYDDRTFIHPVCHPHVIAGNGTIGLEILEDLPDVDTIVVPWGGGGGLCGTASAITALKPGTKHVACEVDTGAPLAASLAAGRPVSLSDHQTSFVDGVGGKSFFPQMWKMASNLVDKCVVVSLSDVCNAMRIILERNCVVAEGAGAAPLSAALTDHVAPGNIVCVVSGGNIDSDKLVDVIEGRIPPPGADPTRTRAKKNGLLNGQT